MSFLVGVIMKPIAERHAAVGCLSHFGKGKRPVARCLIQRLRARSTSDRTGSGYMRCAQREIKAASEPTRTTAKAAQAHRGLGLSGVRVVFRYRAWRRRAGSAITSLSGVNSGLAIALSRAASRLLASRRRARSIDHSGKRIAVRGGP